MIGCHQGVHVDRGADVRERDPDGQVRVERGDVEPEDQLDQHRGAAEQGDVDICGDGNRLDVRGAHDRQAQPQERSQGHAGNREEDREHQPAEDGFMREVLGDDAPLEVGVGQDGGEDADADEDAAGPIPRTRSVLRSRSRGFRAASMLPIVALLPLIVAVTIGGLH